MVPGFLYLKSQPTTASAVATIAAPSIRTAIGRRSEEGRPRSVEMRRDIPNSIEMSAKITAEAMAVSLATFASVMSAVGILGTR